MKLSKEEQETIINFNAKDKYATIYTRDPTFMKQMDKLVREYPDIFQCKSISEIDKLYIVPKRRINIQRPRFLSEVEKEARRNRIKEVKKKKVIDTM